MQADSNEAVADLKRALTAAVGSRFSSSREAARKAGCSADTMSRALSGSQPPPTIDTVKKILKACGNPPLNDPKYRTWSELIEQARPTGRRTPRPPQRGSEARPKTRNPTGVEPSRRLYWFFLAGCGVGNRVAIMPTLDEGEHGEVVRSFLEFIDALERIGFTSEDLRPLRWIADSVKGVMRSGVDEGYGEIILSYFAQMGDVEHRARELGHPDEFRWFLLGKLLYELATFPLLKQFGSKDDDADSIASRVAAMVAVLEMLELAGSVYQAFKSYLELIESGNWVEEYVLRANRLAVTCSLIL